jgi:hypothetical protein
VSLQIFIGQIMGTAVGTELFNNHGWRASAAANLGWQSFALLVLLARGPHCARYTWIGWEGGFAWRKGSQRPQETQKQPEVAEKKAGEECNDAKETSTPVLGETEGKEVAESPRTDLDRTGDATPSK